MSDTPKTDEKRAQDLRVIALQAAVAGSGSNMNEATVLRRAAAFEAYIMGGAVPTPGETRTFAGTDY